MQSSGSQAFLREVHKLAVEECGAEFSEKLTQIRVERERLLNNSWDKILSEEISETEKNVIYREIDFDTIVIFAARYIAMEDYPVLLFRIAEMAIPYGQLEKAERLLYLILSEYKTIITQQLEPKVHQKLGDIAFYRSDLTTALQEYENCKKVFTKIDDLAGITAVNISIGVIHIESGNIETGIKYFKSALDSARENNLKSLWIKVLINLGNIYHISGSFKEAMQSYNEAQDLAQEIGDENLKAYIKHNIGIVYKSQEDKTNALTSFDDSISISGKTMNVRMKGLSYLEKAEVLAENGDLSSGTALATSAFRVFSEIGDRLSIADTYKVLGIIARERKQYAVAVSYLQNSISINREFENVLNIGESYLELGIVLEREGELKQARDMYESALKQFSILNAKSKVSMAEQAIKRLSGSGN